MNKTIIGVYGRAGEGKSSIIKKVCEILLTQFPNAQLINPPVDYSKDILVAVQLGKIKIGIESQGDPNSRMISEQTLKKLADPTIDPVLGGCDVIICATRTRGESVGMVDDIADTYDYHTLWMSSYYSPKLNNDVLNRFAAEQIVEFIKALVIGQL